MASRLIIFDVKDLKDLLVHYYDGKHVPLNGEVLEVGISKYMQRMVSLLIESDEWDATDINPLSGELSPIELIYEGKKTFSWSKKDGDEAVWVDAPDAPHSA